MFFLITWPTGHHRLAKPWSGSSHRNLFWSESPNLTAGRNSDPAKSEFEPATGPARLSSSNGSPTAHGLTGACFCRCVCCVSARDGGNAQGIRSLCVLCADSKATTIVIRFACGVWELYCFLNDAFWWSLEKVWEEICVSVLPLAPLPPSYLLEGFFLSGFHAAFCFRCFARFYLSLFSFLVVMWNHSDHSFWSNCALLEAELFLWSYFMLCLSCQHVLDDYVAEEMLVCRTDSVENSVSIRSREWNGWAVIQLGRW